MKANQMIKKSPNRKRNKPVTIRMNEKEYDELKRKVKDSGLNQQAFVIKAIQNADFV
ncbi:MAG: hypothetical protein K5897_09805 [Eubacterium sp.]|nr:hypothetical protein [Eubacterium sp.]